MSEYYERWAERAERRAEDAQARHFYLHDAALAVYRDLSDAANGSVSVSSKRVLEIRDQLMDACMESLKVKPADRPDSFEQLAETVTLIKADRGEE